MQVNYIASLAIALVALYALRAILKAHYRKQRLARVMFFDCPSSTVVCDRKFTARRVGR